MRGRGYPFDPAFTSHRATDRRMLAFVRVAGRIAGYVACQQDGGGAAEVRRLEIDRRCRGQGLGQLLLGEARAWAAEQGLAALRLETMADNPAAGRFFARYGFTQSDGEGVLHWHLSLAR
nr:GNAT family N-acetyltransferase [Sphingomonas sp. R-74633]